MSRLALRADRVNLRFAVCPVSEREREAERQKEREREREKERKKERTKERRKERKREREKEAGRTMETGTLLCNMHVCICGCAFKVVWQGSTKWPFCRWSEILGEQTFWELTGICSS